MKLQNLITNNLIIKHTVIMNEKNTKKYTGLKNIKDDNYVKPPQTTTEKLSQEEINKLLENYKEVDIKNLKRGIHTRYFKRNKDGTLDFKIGGIILQIDSKLKYVVMMEKGLTWSVQSDSIFYQQMTNNDTIEELQLTIEKNKNSINELVSYIKSLEKTLKLAQESEKKQKLESQKKDAMIEKLNGEFEKLKTKYDTIKAASKQKK